MAYATYDDIEGLVPELAGVDNPDQTTVEGWITRTSNTVDGYLAQKGYTVPVTDTEDASALGQFVIFKVACMSVQTMSLGDDYRQKGEAWCKEYADFIEDVKAGVFKLTSQTATKGRTGFFYTKKESRGRDYTRE